MKVLVCGGRDYKDWQHIADELDVLHMYRGPFTHVIQGGQRGADSGAKLWALRRGVQPVTCDPNWDTYAKGAGHVRNTAMLQLGPDLVVAFPGGNGTADMVKQAKGAGVEVVEIRPRESATDLVA